MKRYTVYLWLSLIWLWRAALSSCCSRNGGSSPWNYGAGMRWLVIAISKRGTTLVRYSDHHGAGSLVNCCGDIIEHSNAGAGHSRNISALNSEFARPCGLAAVDSNQCRPEGTAIHLG